MRTFALEGGNKPDKPAIKSFVSLKEPLMKTHPLDWNLKNETFGLV